MTTSTINPNIPAEGAALSSAAIRANFQAAVNDINALWNSYTLAPTFSTITGYAAVLSINGLAAGGAIQITGGLGSLLSQSAGGAIALTGGVGSGNWNGGAISITGGSTAGGSAANGGAVTLAGGATLATNGTGGALSLLSGAGNGSGNGGAVTLGSGAKGSGGACGLLTLQPVGGSLQVGPDLVAANGSVATALTSLGPTGSHTTVQEWLVVKGTGGATRWVPCF